MAVAMKQKDLRSDSWNHRGVSGREDVKVSRAYTKNLRRSVKNAPRTERISARPSPGPAAQFPKVSVIVPAYNEAENIRDCAIAMRER